MLLRGHHANVWDLRPWERLRDDYDIAVLVTGSNVHQVEGLELEIVPVRTPRDALPGTRLAGGAAYALGERYRRLIDGLEAIHDYMQVENMKRRDPALVAELRKLNPPVAQPLVRVHPETGRKALYLGEQVARRIVGMSDKESASILAFLHQHAVDPLFTYRHRYRVHDLVMWDNRQLMHLALPDFPAGAHRYCVRTTIVGSPSGRVFEG